MLFQQPTRKSDKKLSDPSIVIPAHAGIQNLSDLLDSGSRQLRKLGRNDGNTYTTNL